MRAAALDLSDPGHDAAKGRQHRLGETHDELGERVVVVGPEELQHHAQHEDQDVEPERHLHQEGERVSRIGGVHAGTVSRRARANGRARR